MKVKLKRTFKEVFVNYFSYVNVSSFHIEENGLIRIIRGDSSPITFNQGEDEHIEITEVIVNTNCKKNWREEIEVLKKKQKESEHK